MLIAENAGIIPPKEWEHPPYLRDRDGFSVAILLAFRGIIPPV